MKRKAVGHVTQLSESDCAAEPSLSLQKKRSNHKFYAVETTSGKAAVHSQPKGEVVEGTEVNELKTAELLARELNKGRTMDDVRYLIALMESAQQR